MFSRKRTYGAYSGAYSYPFGKGGGGYVKVAKPYVAKRFKPAIAVKLAAAVRNRYPKLALRGWKNNNSELKYNDVAAALYVADTTGTVTALNLTAVGDDNTTRDGRQICNRSIHVQGILQPVDTSTSASFTRLMLVWDNQPNSGAIATITNILTAATSIAGTNLDNRERFTILRDLRFAQGSISDVATQSFSNGDNTYCVNEFVNLKDVKTTYSGTTAVIGSVATGALLMVTIGNQAANLGGIFNLHTRLRFTDR